MLTETFQERLNWLHPNHYEYSNSRVIVRETLQGGEAEVTCYVSNNALRINLGERNRLHYLKRQKVADAVIFEFSEPQKIIIHIVECKKTVKTREWGKIKEQFEGALLNSLGLAGILGLSDIQNIIFYTAYQNDHLSSVNLRTGPGLISPVEDWISDRVSILSLSSAIHKKIELDSQGKAEVSLSGAR